MQYKFCYVNRSTEPMIIAHYLNTLQIGFFFFPFYTSSLLKNIFLFLMAPLYFCLMTEGCIPLDPVFVYLAFEKITCLIIDNIYVESWQCIKCYMRKVIFKQRKKKHDALVSYYFSDKSPHTWGLGK